MTSVIYLPTNNHGFTHRLCCTCSQISTGNDRACSHPTCPACTFTTDASFPALDPGRPAPEGSQCETCGAVRTVGDIVMGSFIFCCSSARV
ncbi:hypothetical protein NKR19_g3385 [Coniochaeta hoffmannii]|uniref:Uncharacterized protein n=1 Tax=Coniochaeta hoffmannii TaxID=91930 RepID=A0AA38S8T0_9PEZI|nr:hypothetical protein NKR19_g3385 [Coniochaeta hoffmannii]